MDGSALIKKPSLTVSRVHAGGLNMLNVWHQRRAIYHHPSGVLLLSSLGEQKWQKPVLRHFCTLLIYRVQNTVYHFYSLLIYRMQNTVYEHATPKASEFVL